MQNSIKDTQIIILAAGKGTRMGGDIPKVLFPLGSKTMLEHLLENSVKTVLTGHRPVIVVGYEQDKVKEVIGDQVIYAVQEEQLGTGHAVLSALPKLDPEVQQVVVLYGDMPLVQAKTIIQLASIQNMTTSPVTMLTIDLPDYEDWRLGCYNWGRVRRNQDNEIIGITERKDASPELLEQTEVTSAHFAFDVEWLWENLPKLSNNNASGEFYLTALIDMAADQGHKIQSVSGTPEEVVGANTIEEFDLLKKFVK